MNHNNAAQADRHLEPCPFCGRDLHAQWDRNNPKARCRTDGCKGSQLPVLNLDVPDDIVAWNTRAPLSKLRAPVADERAAFVALSDLVNALRERHYGRMPEEVQQAYDRAWTIVFTAPTAALASAPVADMGNPMSIAPVAGEALSDLQALHWAEKYGIQWALNTPDAIREVIADAHRLAAPEASEAVRLDAPAQVGGVRFGKGVHWSTVIAAAQRHHAFMNTPEKEAERIARAQAFVDSIQVDESPDLQGSPVDRSADLQGDRDIAQRLRDNAELDASEGGNPQVIALELEAAAEIDRLRAALSAQPEAQKGCNCATCRPHSVEMRMILCSICGDKRCPHAADHRNECTGTGAQKGNGDA